MLSLLFINMISWIIYDLNNTILIINLTMVRVRVRASLIFFLLPFVSSSLLFCLFVCCCCCCSSSSGEQPNPRNPINFLFVFLCVVSIDRFKRGPCWGPVLSCFLLWRKTRKTSVFRSILRSFGRFHRVELLEGSVKIFHFSFVFQITGRKSGRIKS